MAFKISSRIVACALFCFAGLSASDRPFSMKEVKKWHDQYCIEYYNMMEDLLTSRRSIHLQKEVNEDPEVFNARMRALKEDLEGLDAGRASFDRKHEGINTYLLGQIEREGDARKAVKKSAPKSTEGFVQPKTSIEFQKALKARNLSVVDIRRTSTGDTVCIVRNTINGQIGQLLSDLSVDERLSVS